MEKIKDQFIISYETALDKEGKEICKEVDSMLGENDELLVEKANSYCFFIINSKIVDIDPKLVDRCKKYLDDMRKYRNIMVTLEHFSRRRKTV